MNKVVSCLVELEIPDVPYEFNTMKRRFSFRAESFEAMLS